MYLRGRWSRPLAAGNAVLKVAIAVPALVLLAGGRLIDPDFFATVNSEASVPLANLAVGITGVAIAVVAVWDIVGAFVKAARGRVSGAAS